MSICYYIIDDMNCFQRTAWHGGPEMLTLPTVWENRQYADRFMTKREAEQMLRYWESNNIFDGKIITLSQALDMEEAD